MWLLDTLLRRVVREGELSVIDHDGRTYRYGAPSERFRPVIVRFTQAGAANRVARAPRLGAGEAYMDGRMSVDGEDIKGFVDLIVGNAPWDRGGGGRKALNKGKRRLADIVGAINSLRRSRKNVAHHYDLSDRLYDLFLDADRQYSCAYFTDPSNSLEQAQADKLAHIARKLRLAPGQNVLDIGCGWGGLALHIHRTSGAEVLGITLSEEQLKVARERAAAEGVADKVRFELIDYREVEGRFDRIVSVGMFEHVGTAHYRAFFAKCRELLSDDGVMLLHTIGRFGKPGAPDAFTAKYIFPGGYNPALSEIVAASEQSKLIVNDVETLRLHYAYTLDHWYACTVAAREAIVALYDERFFRMWTFYLAGAAAAFRYGSLCNFQLLYTRRRDALPITRDWLA